ncbi:unnamed protein product, partial [marine sediment metagenome]
RILPLNPIETIKSPRADYGIEEANYKSDLTLSKVYAGNRETGELEFEAFFSDPFVGLTIFTHKTFDDDWNADPETITGAFDDLGNESSIAMYVREIQLNAALTDSIDRLFKGGRCVSRHLISETGKLIREKLIFRFIDQAESGEATLIDMKAQADIDDADSIHFWVADTDGALAEHYIWFDKTGGGGDPTEAGIQHECDIQAAGTENSVALLVAACITGLAIGITAVAAAATDLKPGRVLMVNTYQGDVSDCTQDDGIGGASSACCDEIIILSKALPTQYSDGIWADWGATLHSKDDKIEWGAQEITSANSGLEILKIDFGVDVERDTIHLKQSLVAGLDYITKIIPTCEIDGILSKNISGAQHKFIDELEKKPEDRTKATLKYTIDTNATDTKYDQFTNAFVSEIEGIDDLPEAGKAHKVTIKFRGEKPVYTLSYKYSASVYTNSPIEKIDHDDT